MEAVAVREETTATRGSSSHASPRRERLGPSGWLALAILVVYGVLTFVFPLIPILIVAGAMEELIFSRVPALDGVIWLIAMLVRLRDRGVRRPGLVAWIAIRYAIVSFGVAGLIVMGIGGRTPAYIRFTARFRGQKRESADVASLRPKQWAAPGAPAPSSRRLKQLARGRGGAKWVTVPNCRP